jgi:hypothetical protein
MILENTCVAWGIPREVAKARVPHPAVYEALRRGIKDGAAFLGFDRIPGAPR